MATQKTQSLKGRRMRITRLDECGTPVVGDCSSVVTEGFITVEMSPEKESGDEYISKERLGDFCINEKDPDRTKRTNVTISMCEVDPDVLDIVTDASPILDGTGTDTIGAAFGSTPNFEAFALEVWTKQAGDACTGGDPDWGYFVAPFVTNGSISGSITIENAVMTLEMTGTAVDSTGEWGVNPYGDNPLLATGGFPEGNQWAVVRTTVQPPAATDGCAAVA